MKRPDLLLRKGPSPTARFLLLPAFGIAAFGCGGQNPLSAGAAPACGAQADMFAPVPVRRASGQPPIAMVVRAGDPRAAAAAVVAIEGSAPSVAVSAMVAARLERDGWTDVLARADGQGFRIMAPVDDGVMAAKFVSSVRSALATPLAPDTPEHRAAVSRLAMLGRRPFESPALAAVAQCTGELGIDPSESAADAEGSEGLKRLEAWREKVFGSAPIALGVTGPQPIARALLSAASSASWPSRSRRDLGWPSEDGGGAYAGAQRGPAPVRLQIALRVGSAEGAVGAAARAGHRDSRLVRRLAALPSPFRLVEVAGVARTQGGCISAILESERPLGAGAESAAAMAAVVTRQELERERSRHEQDNPAVPDASIIGGQAARAARSASDPREAAALAAWWALVEPASSEPTRLTVALGVQAPAFDVRETRADLASALDAAGKRFWSAFQAGDASFQKPVLEHRERVEAGQGELWVLLATPCGTVAENAADAGETALAALANVAEHAADDRSVAVDPWITPDGIGLVAHGPRMRYETPAMHAGRVAEQAARSFFSARLGADAVADARTRLLDWIGAGVSSDGRAFAAAAGAVASQHPSWLGPLGTWEGILRPGPEMLVARWSALLEGPVRVAVLANEDGPQVDAALAAVDSWLVRRDGTHACAPVEPLAPPKAGTLSVELNGPRPYAQAIIAAPAPAPDKPERVWFELAAAALGGQDGLLSRSLASLHASADARIVGGSRAAAIAIDIRVAESALEPAVAQVRGLLERMRQGGLTPADLERAVSVLRARETEAAFDPRARLASLWAGTAATAIPEHPSVETWRGWVATGLADDRLVVVLGRPRR